MQVNSALEPSNSQKEAADAAQDIASLIPSISKLPDNDKQLIIREITQTIQVSSSYPMPELLAGYERVEPGLANRIIIMTENDISHTHEMQKAVMQLERQAQNREDISIKCDHNYRMLGLCLAFLAIAFLVGLAAYFVSLGHPAYAAGFGGVVLIGIASAFINGQKKQVAPPNKDPQANKKRRNPKNR